MSKNCLYIGILAPLLILEEGCKKTDTNQKPADGNDTSNIINEVVEKNTSPASESEKENYPEKFGAIWDYVKNLINESVEKRTLKKE